MLKATVLMLAEALNDRRSLLLHNMRCFVCHQFQIGRLFAGAEKDMRTVSKGAGFEVLRSLISRRVLMDAHGAEIGLITPLESVLNGGGQG